MSTLSNEQLAAYVVGASPPHEAERVRHQALQDEALACKLLVMQVCCGMPVAEELLPEEWSKEPVSVATPNIDGQVRQALNAFLAPYLAGRQNLLELQNRQLVDACFEQLFAETTPNASERLSFYRVAANVMAETLCAHAQAVESGTGALPETIFAETVRENRHETTFATSQLHPRRVLQRSARLQELLDFEPDHGLIYLLVMLGGRTPAEVADLLGCQEDVVRDALTTAMAEVHLDDAGDQEPPGEDNASDE